MTIPEPEYWQFEKMESKIVMINRKLITFVFLMGVSAIGVSCKDSPSSTSEEMELEERKVEIVHSKTTEKFSLSPVMKESLAYEMKFQNTPAITENYLESSVDNDTGKVTLVIRVKNQTPDDHCKSMAEKYTRLVKSLSNDTECGKDLGKGEFRYEILVYDEDEKQLLRGEKASSDNYIKYTK